MVKHTSIDWLVQNYSYSYKDYIQINITQKQLQEVKEMNKLEIINANRDGANMASENKPFISGKQYFEQTFKN